MLVEGGGPERCSEQQAGSTTLLQCCRLGTDAEIAERLLKLAQALSVAVGGELDPSDIASRRWTPRRDHDRVRQTGELRSGG